MKKLPPVDKCIANLVLLLLPKDNEKELKIHIVIFDRFERFGVKSFIAYYKGLIKKGNMSQIMF